MVKTVYFLKLLEEKPTACPTSVLAPLELQVSSSKPASEAARVSRAPEAGRVDRRELTWNYPNQSHMNHVHFLSIY